MECQVGTQHQTERLAAGRTVRRRGHWARRAGHTLGAQDIGFAAWHVAGHRPSPRRSAVSAACARAPASCKTCQAPTPDLAARAAPLRELFVYALPLAASCAWFPKPHNTPLRTPPPLSHLCVSCSYTRSHTLNASVLLRRCFLTRPYIFWIFLSACVVNGTVATPHSYTRTESMVKPCAVRRCRVHEHASRCRVPHTVSHGTKEPWHGPARESTWTYACHIRRWQLDSARMPCNTFDGPRPYPLLAAFCRPPARPNPAHVLHAGCH